MKFLLDSKYLLYRAYQLPKFTDAHRDTIASMLANYIYIKYTSTSEDLVPIYSSADDVSVDVTTNTIDDPELQVSYLTTKHEGSTQIVAFLRRNDKVTVLVKSSTPVFLVQMLESLDFETPLILQLLPMTSETMVSVINGLQPLLAEDNSLLGEVNFAFTSPVKLTSDSLKEILVTVPRKDSQRLVKDSDSPPIEALYAFLEKTTTLNFHNLVLANMNCYVVSMDGKRIRLSGQYLLDSQITTMLCSVCDTF